LAAFTEVVHSKRKTCSLNTSMGDVDDVTRAFEKMRAEVDGMLRRHEAEVRRAMLAAPQLQQPESCPKEQAGEVPPVELQTKTAGDDETEANEKAGSPCRNTSWKKMLKENEKESQVQRPWEKMREKARNLKESMLNRLPRLVSKESRVAKLSKSNSWAVLRSLVIFLDAIVVIFDVSHASIKAKDMKWQGAVTDVTFSVVLTDLFFAFCFLDLLFQFILEFPRFDFIKGRTGYRWFNILVTVEQLLQVVSQHAQPDQRADSTFRIVVTQFSVLRLLRACVVLPEIAAKLELGLQELRVMLHSLIGAVPPLLCCATPVAFLLTTFGVFVSEGALVWLVKNDSDSAEHKSVVAFFGTLDLTLVSLYKALLGGMDWGDLYDVMMPLEWYLRIGFLCVICFNFIAMVNIVAAVFIRVAFVRSENDKQFQIQKELNAKQAYLETMGDIFKQLDEDGDGEISLNELQAHLESPDIGAYFSKLGVDVNEVEKLFMLLDEDGSGDIDREEFIFGCLRLKGEAKSLDLAILHREVASLKHAVLSHCNALARGRSDHKIEIFDI